MLQENFEVLGYFGDDIYFRYEGKIIVMKNRLPKAELILKLKVEPEDVKELRDEILVQASKKHLTYVQKEELFKR